MPAYSTFEEAWAAFIAGSPLQTAEEHREEFTRGRAQFLAFQIPADNDEIVALADRVLDDLADVARLEPTERLHITVLPVGFQVIETRLADDILRPEVTGVAERAAVVVKRHRRFEVVVGPVSVLPDALVLEVRDDGALALREELRGCLPERLAQHLEEAPPFLPHVSIASFASADAGGPLRERLPALRDEPPARVEVRRLELARWWFTGFDEREDVEVEVVRAYGLR